MCGSGIALAAEAAGYDGTKPTFVGCGFGIPARVNRHASAETERYDVKTG
ncbi:MAG TPA: hypothetical protein VFE05_03195 [Longimicrobiaceae bacterium]|jgi:hypothetical protein|nr:hypothetical protein [Longimicrobiaceae bacterium]